MGAGANIGGFGAGFGKGLANALLSNRDRADQKKREQQARQDRLFQAMLPTLIDNVENVADLEPFLAQHLPEQFGGKPGKKGGSPFDNIKRFLGPLVGMRGKQDAGADRLPQQSGIGPVLLGGGTGTPAPREVAPQPAMFPPAIDMPGGQDPFGMLPGDNINAPNFKPAIGNGLPDLAAAGRAAVGQAAQTTQPVNRRTLLGVPILSPAEKFERTEQQAEMQIAARRRLAERLGLPPEAATAYALTGQLISPKPGEGFTLGADQVRYDAAGKEIARGPAKPATASTNVANNIDEAIVMAHNAGNQAEVQRLLKLKAESVAAGREPKSGAGDEATAIAEIAADNPSVLQGLTPTITGQAMAALKRNPQLYARYEAVRMQPIRQTATTMIDALKKLLILDKNGNVMLDKNGNVLGLSEGGKSIFGEYTPAGVRGFIPGKDATDAAAALEQLTGQQVLDTIAEMKKQSKSGATGFGSMNLSELNVLESAATQLKKRLSEPTAAQKLGDLLLRYQQILAKSPIEQAGTQPAGPPAQPGAGGAPAAPAISGPEWRGGKLYVNGQPIG